MNKLAIIGGSGLYNIDGIREEKWLTIDTPWGKTSDQILEAKINDKYIYFLPRHGRGHKINPSNINFRANIDALKQLGVTDIVSVSAVGSLKENLPPGKFVIVDQFIDRTFARNKTFFDDDIVAHVSMAHPTDDDLMRIAEASLIASNITFNKGGTYLCMEGPQFSSLAESKLYQSWGCDVIGMTNMPEAKLCREADIRYVSIGMVTDYDCWNKNFFNVTVDNVLEILKSNTEKSKEMIKIFISHYTNQRIDNKLDIYKSIVTPLSNIKKDTIIKLKNIIPKLYKGVIKETKT